MNIQEAIQIIVNDIWIIGEINDPNNIGARCLVPSDIAKNPTIYHKASDVLINEKDYTHYDMKWEVRGRSVRIRFFRGDSLGAAIITEENLIDEIIVDIN